LGRERGKEGKGREEGRELEGKSGWREREGGGKGRGGEFASLVLWGDRRPRL